MCVGKGSYETKLKLIAATISAKRSNFDTDYRPL
jgi:hypothetical protein